MGHHLPAIPFPREAIYSFHYTANQTGHTEGRGYVLALLQGLRGSQRH